MMLEQPLAPIMHNKYFKVCFFFNMAVYTAFYIYNHEVNLMSITLHIHRLQTNSRLLGKDTEHRQLQYSNNIIKVEQSTHYPSAN